MLFDRFVCFLFYFVLCVGCCYDVVFVVGGNFFICMRFYVYLFFLILSGLVFEFEFFFLVFDFYVFFFYGGVAIVGFVDFVCMGVFGIMMLIFDVVIECVELVSGIVWCVWVD